MSTISMASKEQLMLSSDIEEGVVHGAPVFKLRRRFSTGRALWSVGCLLVLIATWSWATPSTIHHTLSRMGQASSQAQNVPRLIARQVSNAEPLEVRAPQNRPRAASTTTTTSKTSSTSTTSKASSTSTTSKASSTSTTSKTSSSTTTPKTSSSTTTSKTSSSTTTSKTSSTTTTSKTSTTATSKTSSTTTAPVATAALTANTWWKPKAGATWQIVYADKFTNAMVEDKYKIYNVDLFDTDNSTISYLKKTGNNVICYFSAGTVENWRVDASAFPAAAIGNSMEDWEGEAWIDTGSQAVRDIMTKRIQLAKAKGCDAIDPDNIDGYQDANDCGLHLTLQTAINYVTWLATTAHSYGLGSGLKNGGDLVSKVLDKVDFEVNEQCAKYNECGSFQPFIQAGKPVFHIEYTEDSKPSASFMKKSCTSAGTAGFSNLIKHMDLDSWTATCS